MWTFPLLLLAASAAAAVDDEPVISEDEDVPTLLPGETEQREQLRVDPRTGARLYDGYRVLRTVPESQEHLEVLKFVSNGKRKKLCT